jgi:hypothetical protein
MTGLDSWLRQATRHLAHDSAAQVRTEIQEHYELARDAAIENGATPDGADRIALDALGDAKTANCQYRHVLLTRDEAKILRDGKRETTAICSHPGLKGLILAAPVAALVAAILLLFAGRVELGRDIFTLGIAMSPLFAALVLPIYTPARARVFRRVKWIVIASALALVYGPEAYKWSWLLISCLGPIAWTEWTRASIRRKLPIAAWPKHLYL